MSNLIKDKWLPIIFAFLACTWMPHWSCHYYRLETGSSFTVGNWEYTSFESVISMIIYSVFIILNFLSVSFTKFRLASAVVSGTMHLFLGILHTLRIFSPFKFEVFGFTWSIDSSIREAALALPIGVFCILLALNIYRQPR
jgi:hypothetical protein